MQVELIDANTHGLETVIKALNKCRNKECTEQTIKRCIRNNELACLEFCWFAFEIKDISRVVLAEITRHRHFSFMVESQRHVEPDMFIVPHSIYANANLIDSYNAFIGQSQILYDALLDNGIPKEDARYVLPNATATNMVVAGNGRAWFEYLQKRLCQAKVQPEHFNLAFNIWQILMKDYSCIFGFATPCLTCNNQCKYAQETTLTK
jgi:thymidylate synthase (FAD)